ncbi:hypothetical protein NEF87_002628 [Candidatus Lokiarchaeum ossiferum]|uniref:Uncharacterized protein n=1 Tax=Candidatus Lokiarchaeum ossiferum TaxID=2951803 RepID=A0ABY6HS52_9ARCH|nr:hypothetical protein NEF87_002628 [Candidatus Lokiarchaeum sp. B-35]
MRKVRIICPVCSKSRRITLSDDIFNFDAGSLLKFPIKSGTVCSHQFIIIMDYNFSIRDYEIITTEQELTQFHRLEKKNISLYEFISY